MNLNIEFERIGLDPLMTPQLIRSSLKKILCILHSDKNKEKNEDVSLLYKFIYST